MTLSVARFNRQLQRIGQDMDWRRAAMCPCRDPESGAARKGCPVCRSAGVIWSPAVGSRAGVSGMKVQREWASFGEFASGDVVVSVGSDTPLYACGENDRVIFTDSSAPFDLVLTQGDGQERVRQPVVAFDRCFWLSDDNQSIVPGDLPMQGADGFLSWAAGAAAPPPERQYTVTGRARPEYFMFKDLGQDRAHYGGLALPRKLVLRKFDLFGRGSS